MVIRPHNTTLLHHFEFALRRDLRQQFLLILIGRLILLGRIQVVRPRPAVQLELILHLPRTKPKLVIDRCLRFVVLHVVPPDGHAAKLARIVRRIYGFVLYPFLSVGRGRHGDVAFLAVRDDCWNLLIVTCRLQLQSHLDLVYVRRVRHNLRSLGIQRLAVLSWLRAHLLVAEDVGRGAAEDLGLLEGALLETRAGGV